MNRTLRPRRFRTLLLLVLSAALTAVGVWFVTAGERNGWLLAVFCGIGVVVFAVNLLPNSAYLRLDADGLTFCALFRTHFYRWTDLGTFRVGEVGGKRMVVVTISADSHRLPTQSSAAAPLTGQEGAFVDSYGLTPERLADLLNVYREAYVEAKEREPMSESGV